MPYLLPTKPTRTALKTNPTAYFNSWCFKSVGKLFTLLSNHSPLVREIEDSTKLILSGSK